jgi:hypothetical protein
MKMKVDWYQKYRNQVKTKIENCSMEVWKFNITSDESRLFIVVRFSVHFQALLILVGLGYAGIAILLLLLPIM